MTSKLLIILLSIASLGFTSCTKSVAPATSQFLTQHIGESCAVEFRRDALGAAASSPIPPSTDDQNGATVSQKGKLLSVEGEGIVIESVIGNTTTVHTIWIPYHAILNVILQSHK